MKVQFQSLFYWKSFCNVKYFKKKFWFKTGFNPCFIGNPSATALALILNQDCPSFNPCFIGNPSATGNIIRESFSIKKFQSLFYWKSFCNNITLACSLYMLGVSILVLLEILLQPLITVGNG